MVPQPPTIGTHTHTSTHTPLQIGMKGREQVCEALMTGVKALDVLTPLGRGASLLVVGPRGAGKSRLAEDALLGQKGSGVCVFVCVRVCECVCVCVCVHTCP